MEQKKELIDALLEELTTGEELTTFLATMQKRGIEKILQGELDGHLGYSKNEKVGAKNARNRFSTKTIKTSFGESQI